MQNVSSDKLKPQKLLPCKPIETSIPVLTQRVVWHGQPPLPPWAVEPSPPSRRGAEDENKSTSEDGNFFCQPKALKVTEASDAAKITKETKSGYRGIQVGTFSIEVVSTIDEQLNS